MINTLDIRELQSMDKHLPNLWYISVRRKIAMRKISIGTPDKICPTQLVCGSLVPASQDNPVGERVVPVIIGTRHSSALTLPVRRVMSVNRVQS